MDQGIPRTGAGKSIEMNEVALRSGEEDATTCWALDVILMVSISF